MRNLRTAVIVSLVSAAVVAFVLDRHRREAELDHLRESLAQLSSRPAPGGPVVGQRSPAPQVVASAREAPARHEAESDGEPIHDEQRFEDRLEAAFDREGPAAEDAGRRRDTAGLVKAALSGSGQLQSLGCRGTMCRAELVFDDIPSLNQAAMRLKLPLAVASYEERDDGRLHAVLFLGREGDLGLEIPAID